MSFVRKLLLIVAACTVPVFFFLQVMTAYQYQVLQRDVSALEKDQKDWLEKNKKIIAGISVLRSPERIEKIARDELGLRKIDSSRIKRLVIE